MKMENGVKLKKSPITDPSKSSLSGLVDLSFKDGVYKTSSKVDDSILDTVFENGHILKREKLQTIRSRLEL